MATRMSNLLADRTKSYYVCSRCWGPLIVRFAPDDREASDVECANPDCDGDGFVTRKYADRRRGESGVDYAEALTNLRQALGLPAPKPADQIIKDLGF